MTDEQQRLPPFVVGTVAASELEFELNSIIEKGYVPKNIMPHQGLAATAPGGSEQLFTVVGVLRPPMPTKEQIEEMQRQQQDRPNIVVPTVVPQQS